MVARVFSANILTVRWEVEMGKFPEVLGSANLICTATNKRFLPQIRWKGENQDTRLFSYPHMCAMACTPILTRTHLISQNPEHKSLTTYCIPGWKAKS